MSKEIVKLLKDVQEEIEKSKKEFVEATKDLTNPEIKTVFRDICIPIQRIKIVRDGNLIVRMSRWPVTSPQAALDLFREYFKEVDREICAIMTLNSQNEWIGITTANVGSLDAVEVDLFEIFKIVASDNAASFIVAHNHPSGKSKPSDHDLVAFDDLKEQGRTFKRPLLDFVILADGNDSYYSHREEHYDAF